ncbi:hypothetical protein BC938DRAFT_473659 [Jimgerdemannia flammicorona]|uniref:Uncharacterized protein n=1 Tax=Jimgerdemannia flammicorona TaxID=994334 RepID=A0A433Q3R1_9FUNG|nr:hypothetical protein BC938DRAFT_473659 [Jimgerdemannia flammicorona]
MIVFDFSYSHRHCSSLSQFQVLATPFRWVTSFSPVEISVSTTNSTTNSTRTPSDPAINDGLGLGGIIGIAIGALVVVITVAVSIFLILQTAAEMSSVSLEQLPEGRQNSDFGLRLSR